MAGLYHQLHSTQSELNDKLFTKSSMCAVSHGLEQVIMKFDLDVELFVTFQQFEFFTAELERYLELDQVCQQIFVFCQGVEEEVVTEFENTTFVDLAEEDPLLKEWDLVVNYPTQPMLLATHETPEFQMADIDDFRTFMGFLSFAPQEVKDAVDYMVAKLKEYGIDYTPHYQLESKAEAKSALDDKVALFLNQSLQEVEFKTEELYQNNLLLAEALEKNKDRTLEMVKRLCYAAEYRDEDTASHLVRMSFYSTFIYSKLVSDPEKIRQMQYASLMHDIGKVGIADSILLKPGQLTDEEYQEMKQHTVIGRNILEDSNQELMQMAENIAYLHHEQWSGEGYPTGRQGTDIPLEARVVALADVFDALSSQRVYKDAYSIEKSVEIIKEERNQHFEGRIVDIFLEHLDKIVEFKSALDSRLVQASEEEIVDIYLAELNQQPFNLQFN
ncbi:MAG: HD domain-containing phosphohydrolase [Bacillota bacterium]